MISTRATAAARTGCRKKCTPLLNAFKSLEDALGNIVPKYLALDIQTNNLGSGVGYSEIVRHPNILMYDLGLIGQISLCLKRLLSHIQLKE